MQTKLELITRRARENPKMRFTSLAHHLGAGSAPVPAHEANLNTMLATETGSP